MQNFRYAIHLTPRKTEHYSEIFTGLAMPVFYLCSAMTIPQKQAA